jgi:hypothetical protein
MSTAQWQAHIAKVSAIKEDGIKSLKSLRVGALAAQAGAKKDVCNDMYNIMISLRSLELSFMQLWGKALKFEVPERDKIIYIAPWAKIDELNLLADSMWLNVWRECPDPTYKP